METFTTQDLIEELRQYQLNAVPRREGGVTHQEWASAQKVSEASSRKQLWKLIEKEILEREWSLCPDGQRRWVYYKK